MVETAPLPARAQFLNVIESVFSGMARAIIHNSDYKSVDEAKAAVDRYFAERDYFRQHPRRAGKKSGAKSVNPQPFLRPITAKTQDIGDASRRSGLWLIISDSNFYVRRENSSL